MTTEASLTNECRAARSGTFFAVAVTLLFTIVCGLAISHHEMWRDELQAWLIARDSGGVGELLQRIRYEGHPAIWYLLLFGVTRITHHPESMQVLHLAIAAGVVFVFARSAPFPRWVRLLFCFGYFPVYEYGVVARNYSLGVLFLFAAAALFPRRRERPWLLGAMLVLAAHTSVMALIVGAAFAGTVLVEPFISRDPRARVLPAAKTFLVAIVGMLLAGVLLSPPSDTGYGENWTQQWTRLRAESVLGLFAKALLPIPGGRSLWGQLWLETGSHHVAPMVALILVACVLPYLFRRKLALLMFAAGTSALFLFFYTKLDGSLRHHGFLFINLVLAFWLGEVTTREAGERAAWPRASLGPGVLLGGLATTVLAIHLGIAAISVGQEVSLVFSAGRATAALLVEHGLDELPLVGDWDFSLPPVLGYLPQRTVYYPRGKRFGSFVVLDKARTGAVTDEEVFGAARELGRSSQSAVGIVLNRHASPAAAADAEEIGCIAADVHEPESYCVYRLAPPSDDEIR